MDPEWEISIKNTILAGNTATYSPDCSVNISSGGHNLLGNITGCTFTPTAGDITNTDPQLGALVGSPAYHPLRSTSPAINAGSDCLPTDQRGVSRGSTCDIGAYEYTTPGAAARIMVAAGNGQHAGPGMAYPTLLQAAVLDYVGSPVQGVTVTFTAPSSGASGTFAGTGTNVTTAVTDQDGIATAAILTANAIFGAFTVTAAASGVPGIAVFNLENAAWYVSPSGSDANSCSTPAAPCAYHQCCHQPKPALGMPS